MGPNSTGILIDIYQASWIGTISMMIWALNYKFNAFLHNFVTKFLKSWRHLRMTPLTNKAMWHFSDNNPAYSSAGITKYCSLTGCSFTTGWLLLEYSLQILFNFFYKRTTPVVWYHAKVLQSILNQDVIGRRRCLILCRSAFKRDGDGKLDVYVKGFQPNISLPYAAGDGNDIWWCPGVSIFWRS